MRRRLGPRDATGSPDSAYDPHSSGGGPFAQIVRRVSRLRDIIMSYIIRYTLRVYVCVRACVRNYILPIVGDNGWSGGRV